MSVPSGCSRILVKAWGAGGGGHKGGTGGFSVGVIELKPSDKVQVIVGGRGILGASGERGEGGFNGGGYGGEGGVTENYAFGSGGGGGGCSCSCSEVLVNDKAVIVAGGGGGQGRSAVGMPGGGVLTKEFTDSFFL